MEGNKNSADLLGGEPHGCHFRSVQKALPRQDNSQSPKTPRQGLYLVGPGLAARGLPSGALLHHRSGHSAGQGSGWRTVELG